MEWEEVQVILAVKSCEVVVFEKTPQGWFRTDGSVITKVRSLTETLRAATNQWGRLLCAKVPGGDEDMVGLLAILATGEAAVAIAPRDSVANQPPPSAAPVQPPAIGPNLLPSAMESVAAVPAVASAAAPVDVVQP